MANIKCVVADILCGAADILHGAAVILHDMASILRDVPDILHFLHQFLRHYSLQHYCLQHFALGTPSKKKNRIFHDIVQNSFDTYPPYLRGTFKSKAPLRVQFSPALGGGGGGKGLKPKLLLGFTK